MRRSALIWVSGGLALILLGCDLLSGPGDCQTDGRRSLIIRVRDQDGDPALLGSRIHFVNDGDHQIFGNFPLRPPGALEFSVLWGNRAGRFLVVVEKPWYRTYADGPIRVPGDECGVLRGRARAVDATIVLRPGAPPVRSIEIQWPLKPPIFPFPVSPCTRTYSLETYIDTTPGVSQEVMWTVQDSEIASVTEAGVLTGVCGEGGSTYVVAASSLDPSVRDSIEVAVAPQP